MNEIIEKEQIIVENMIYEINGQQVMMDSDLAALYGVETKRINEAVKNNPNKFPERFCFKISEKEYNFLKSKFSTSKGGSRKGHTVFTEQGVAMLATILKSSAATKVSIAIMDAFVLMRHYVSYNLLEQKYINNQVMKNTEDIKLLQESFSKFEEKKQVSDIYFNGQIYDAYSKIYDIFSKTKSDLIIIDSYADNTILDIIKRLKVNVIIITKANNLLTNQDILKYNKQYHNLKVIYDNTFHDRYFILDKENIYHCGASINKIGYKTFSITLINDNFVLETLLDRVCRIINR
ncbi:MAG: ORF6N domain-containing protein [Ruminococcus sp.]|nr:ORF6N domain-containing protein [Ruminococcus sp.]